MTPKQRLIVGISGASGIIYGIRLLEVLRRVSIESHLVVSKSAEITRDFETDMTAQELRSLADVTYSISDISAAISSGSFKTMGMVIIPCSIRTLSEISNGITSNLLSRAADVVLKERRRLVLVVRETPLHAGHLKNMLAVTESGAIIAPPVPAFYNCPKTLDDIINHTVGRVLDLFDIEAGCVQRWGEHSTTFTDNFHSFGALSDETLEESPRIH
ncbi:MAG: UbiX family flavin prenyltransferase [Brasilonema angustatum HA4187-MV1]|jgi:4-hydroxy-3-polyprenylbenzoate decarboxylase|nr:UbiX family flavin prenyltransferase [Brasilonema angustatum HA4187-MV1]